MFYIGTQGGDICVLWTHFKLTIFRTLTLFSDNSYSFHRIALKLCGQLDHGAAQRILFQRYSTPNIDRVITFFF